MRTSLDHWLPLAERTSQRAAQAKPILALLDAWVARYRDKVDPRGPLDLPAADVRRPVSLLVLTGDPDEALVRAVDAAGFADRVLISFSGRPSDAADVAVGLGEAVAAAWERAAAEAAGR